MIPCLLPSACLGIQNSSISEQWYFPTGECAQGYRGKLCGECDEGLTRNSQFECTRCPPLWQNVLFLFGACLIFFCLFLVLVKASLAAIHKPSSVFTVFFKVMANHLQLLALIASFDLSWPSPVRAFLSLFQPIASVTESVFSLDCFLIRISSIPPYYLTLAIYELIPFLFLLLISIFWCIRHPPSRKPGLASSRIVTSSFIFLFLIHPSLSALIFSSFLCHSIDGDRWLLADLSQQCWAPLSQSSHSLVAGLGGVGGVLLWAFGTPIAAFLLLYQSKDKLDTLVVRERYYFLYNGFRPKAYFWESAIMLRKLSVVFVSTLLSPWGNLFQSYFLLFLLLLFTLWSAHYKPYSRRVLNRIEVFSLGCSLLTVYCGLYSISSSSLHNNEFSLSVFGEWLVFVLIVSSNLAFILVWLWALFASLSSQLLNKCPRLHFVCVACCLKEEVSRQLRAQKTAARYQEYYSILESISEKIQKLKAVLSSGVELTDKDKLQRQIAQLHQISKKIDLSMLHAKSSIHPTRQNKSTPKLLDSTLSSVEAILDDKPFEDSIPLQFTQINKQKRDQLTFREPQADLGSLVRSKSSKVSALLRTQTSVVEKVQEELKVEDFELMNAHSLTYDFTEKEELKKNKRRMGILLKIPRSITLREKEQVQEQIELEDQSSEILEEIAKNFDQEEPKVVFQSNVKLLVEDLESETKTDDSEKSEKIVLVRKKKFGREVPIRNSINEREELCLRLQESTEWD